MQGNCIKIKRIVQNKHPQILVKILVKTRYTIHTAILLEFLLDFE